jgi:tripartite-type tricarboxylate transporter receptor subunit TctC
MKRLLIAMAIAAPAFAQDYPSKPIRVVVGLAAGGGTDLVARTVMPKAGEALGQQVIVENRAGVSGMVAAEYVARSAPDGYTLLFAPQGTVVTNVVLYRKLPYAASDLLPVSLAATFPAVLAVNSEVPARNVQELVTWLKANPTKANAAFSGGAFHIGLELFKVKTGTAFQPVQYKGANEVVQSVASGTTQLTLVDTGPVFGALKSGRIRGIAVTSPQRLGGLPDIPTVHELGFPELELDFWMGVFAPAKTPMPVVRRLETAINRAVQQKEVKDALDAKLTTAAGSTSEELAKRIAGNVATAESIRKAANIPYLD